jgi:hypothetical protein
VECLLQDTSSEHETPPDLRCITCVPEISSEACQSCRTMHHVSENSCWTANRHRKSYEAPARTQLGSRSQL